jgi:hypothetical protein
VPSANRWLTIVTILTWGTSILTTAYYMSLYNDWVEGAKIMWCYNGALTMLVGGVLRVGIRDEDDKLLRNLSTLQIVTGVTLILLALVVVHSVVELV